MGDSGTAFEGLMEVEREVIALNKQVSDGKDNLVLE